VSFETVASWQQCTHESRRISVVGSHNQAAASEGIVNWEVVRSRVCELVKEL
jgi:hypothetical protein